MRVTSLTTQKIHHAVTEEKRDCSSIDSRFPVSPVLRGYAFMLGQVRYATRTR
jgi:hypothetical protein